MTFALATCACTPPRKKADTDAIRFIRFQGNGALFSGHNDLQLRSVMSLKSSPVMTIFPFMFFTRPTSLSTDTLRADAVRLETWYAHHGWFDARVTGWEVRRARVERDDRAGVVDIFGHIQTGPQSMIRDITWSGAARGAAGGVVARSGIRQTSLGPGDPFSLAGVRADAALVARELKEHGHAYASVSPTIDAYPAQESVDVTYEVDAGIQAVIGKVDVSGLRRVDEALVRSTFRFLGLERARTLDRKRLAKVARYEERGRAVPERLSEPVRPELFKLSALRKTQQELFETGLFSLVDVQPDLSDPTAEEVPVSIALTESKFRRIRMGVGLRFDYFNLQPRLDVQYRDVRFAGSDLQVDAEAAVGAIIGVVREDQGQPVEYLFTGLGDLRFHYPWLMRRSLSIEAGAQFKQDAQFGSLPYWKIGADVGLRYRPPRDRRWALTGGLVWEYFQYLDETAETRLAARVQFGGDFVGDVYRLLSVDVGLQFDNRDDPIFTRRGSYWNLILRQSIPIPTFDDPTGLASSFRYAKIEAEVRGYQGIKTRKNQVVPPVVLAGKLHGVALIPQVKGSALPYPDLAFLGGPNSLRGYRANQVGPYDAICNYPDGRPFPTHNNGERVRVDRTYLPRGGSLALEGMGEARVDVGYGVSLAAFGDGGLLYSRPAVNNGVASTAWGAGGGVGLRYASPIGPIRIDIGLRPVHPWDLGRPYDADSGATSAFNTRYYGCNGADVLPRAYDLRSTGVGRRRSLRDGANDWPVGINIFLAIGEAF